jgi:hypothetical protein
MKVKQLNNASNSIQSPILTQMLAVGTLVIGASVVIAAAPAGAVVINNGQLAFNNGTLNTSGTIVPGVGNTFTATFNGTGFAIISTSNGDFLPLLPTGPKAVASSSVSFLYDTLASNYKTTSPLVFDFGVGSGTFTIATGSAFQDTVSTTAGRSNFNFLGSSGSFTNGANTTVIPLTSFNFDVDDLANTNPSNLSPNGSYSLVTDIVGRPGTQVPEPFTLVGTILGGTAAIRMKKKLADIAKK